MQILISYSTHHSDWFQRNSQKVFKVKTMDTMSHDRRGLSSTGPVLPGLCLGFQVQVGARVGPTTVGLQKT